MLLSKKEMGNFAEVLGKFWEINHEAEIVGMETYVRIKATDPAGIMLAEAILPYKCEKFYWFLNIQKLAKILKRCTDSGEIIEENNTLTIKSKNKKFPSFPLLDKEKEQRDIPVVEYDVVSEILTEKILDILKDIEVVEAEDVRLKLKGQELAIQGLKDYRIMSETLSQNEGKALKDHKTKIGYEILSKVIFDFGKKIKFNWQSDRPFIIEYEKEGVKLKFAVAPRNIEEGEPD